MSLRFNKHHPQYGPTAPDVLMAGFRAAGWTCCGTCALALVIAIVGMRGIGLVGQQRTPQGSVKSKSDIEMGSQNLDEDHSQRVIDPASRNSSVTTLATSVEVVTTNLDDAKPTDK